MLGQSGAVKLITSAEDAPQTDAARLFPHAARANHSIFFDKQGGVRSAADVYRVLVAQHDGTATPPLPAVAAAPVQPAAPAGPRATVALTPVASPSIVATPPAQAAMSAPEPGPMFSNLFSSERRDAVSPFVRELWGARAGLVQPASAPAGLLDPGAVQPGASQASAPISAAVVTAPVPVGGTSFQFLRPDAASAQGTRPI